MNQTTMQDSPLKRFWRVIYPLGLYLLIQMVVLFGADMAAFAVLAMKSAAAGTRPDLVQTATEVSDLLMEYSFEMTALSAALTIPFLILFRHMDFKRRKKAGILKRYEGVPLWQYLLPAVLGAAICIGGNNIITFSGLTRISDGYQQVLQSLYKGRFLVEILGIGLLVPAAEEMIFRGLMYSRFREFLSPLAAGLVTSFAFAVFHGNLVQGLYAFFVGASLCFVYERYHSLWAPYILHAAANVISVVISETPKLGVLVTEGAVFYLATALSAVLIVLFVYLVDRFVSPAERTEAA